MFLEALALLLAFCVYRFWLWYRRPKFSLERPFEDHIHTVMANVDDDDSDDEEDEGLDPSQNRTVFQAKLVRIAKAEFGPLRRTEANRLMVRKYLRDTMREHGLRPSHISKHLDVVVRMVFIPSRAEIDAHRIGASFEAHMREREVTSDWTSMFADFGRMLGFGSE